MVLYETKNKMTIQKGFTLVYIPFAFCSNVLSKWPITKLNCYKKIHLYIVNNRTGYTSNPSIWKYMGVGFETECTGMLLKRGFNILACSVSPAEAHSSVFPEAVGSLALAGALLAASLGEDSALGTKAKAAELIQYLLPVGRGPSSKRWPRCAPHWLQPISTLCIP